MPTNSPAHAAVNGFSIEELAARGGISSEHVVLSSGAGEELFPAQRSTVVRKRIKLHNPVRRATIELRIFKDNLMNVIEQRGKNRATKRVVDLRFLDPSPKLSRFVAKKTLQLALGCLASGSSFAILALASIFPIVTAPLAFGLLIAAAVAGVRYAHCTHETVEFRTKHGRAVVLSLVANTGCMRSYRAAVPSLVAAIRFANGKAPSDQRAWLREEVREHYRLAAVGVISRNACEQATRLILARF